MKRLIFTLLFAATALMGFCAGKSLFVSFSDGSRIEFALAAQPKVTMADDMLTVETADGTKASYELWKVLTFTFDETSLGIREVAAREHLRLDGNQLIVEGSTARVRIFSIDGRELSVAPIHAGDYTVIDLNGLSSGVYVINANGKSVKISKR